MPGLNPTFSLTIGSLQSTSADPQGGPTSLRVARDMDIAADCIQIELAERAGIQLGDPASLELGYDGNNEKIFTGEVVSLRPSIHRTTVIALGKMNSLLNLRTAATYEGQSAGSIARDLISQAGLEEGEIQDGPALPRFAIDRRLNAYMHLKGLANRLGFELYTDRDGKIMFKAFGEAAGLDAGDGLMAAAAGAATSLSVGEGEYQYKKHLIWAAGDSRSPALGSLEVGGESPTSSQGDQAIHWLTTDDNAFRGSAGSGDPKRLLLDQAARTKDLSDRFAAGRLAIAQRTTHQISIIMRGRPQIELGDQLSVSDLPDDLLNGQGYLRAILHQFDAQAGFLTTLRLAMEEGI